MPDKVMNILSILHVYSIYISFQIADDRVYYFFASATAHHSDEAYVLRWCHGMVLAFINSINIGDVIMILMQFE